MIPVHIVVTLRGIAVHIAIPIADEMLLVEDGAIGTEEAKALSGACGVGADAERLAATLHVRVVTCREERERVESLTECFVKGNSNLYLRDGPGRRSSSWAPR